MLVYLYILGSSTHPDYIKCPVPFYVDERAVFFGPCKTELRRQLRDQLLSRDCDDVTPNEELYLVGFNGASPKRKRKRKVVWAGRIERVMTFARAWDELVGPRYEALRNMSYGPLHVQPLRGDDGGLVGYRHTTRLHEDNCDWIKDLTEKGDPGPYHVVNETEIYVTDGTAWDVFERDACFLLENVFWARGSGIAVDEEIVEILREAQPDRRQEIDNYAVFGFRRDGSVDGRTGWWLEIKGNLARRLIAAIKRGARELEPVQDSVSTIEIQARCNCVRSKKRDLGQPPQPPSPPPRRKKIC